MRLAWLAVLVAATVLALAALFAGGPAQPVAPDAGNAFAEAPLAFAPNQGQAAPEVRYQAQAAGFGVEFTDSGALLSMPGEAAGSVPIELDMRFVGANPVAEPTAQHRAEGTVNYVHGNNPADWQQNIPTFAQVSYPSLWPGVDMAFRGQGGALKYEFAVSPGANPANIALAYGGAQSLAIGSSGALQIETAGGTVRDAAPVSYQMVDGRRVPVESRYVLNGKTGYGFEVGRYDQSLPLVIDPGISYATFLGSTSYDEANGVKVDSAGNAYVVGTTGTDSGAAMTTTPGAFDTTPNGNYDVFVAKLAPDGQSYLYSTFIGGPGQDNGYGIAIDGDGAAYVTGSAQSGFPTTPGAADETFGGGSHDVFVAKLSPSGGSLLYSTYYGAGNFDQGQGIDVDAAGHAYVTGYASGGFPTTPDAYQASSGFGVDAFSLKLAPDGKSVVYSTVIGGPPGEVGYAIVVDSTGHAYITGGGDTSTQFANYPTTTDAYDRTGTGTLDAFVTKVAPDGKSLIYSTLLGGTRGDRGLGIDIDSTGHAYVAGETGGGNPTTAEEFPTTPGAFDETKGSQSNDGFVTKVAPNGQSLVYSTLLGGNVGSPGSEPDGAADIFVNGSGQAYVTGYTTTSDFPTTSDAQQSTPGGSFVTQLAASGASLIYSSYYSAAGSRAIDVDTSGSIYIAGYDGGGMPTTPNAVDRAAANGEGFAAKFGAPPQCSDGIDNDTDGQTDHPADQGCSSASDNSESPDPPQCNDRLDNDSDGQTNFPADQGCDSLTDTTEAPDPPECNDRLDNDGDGQTNFPADQGCDSLTDTSESGDPPECNDRLDNDGDGASNFPADPGCDSLTDTSESPDPAVPQPTEPEPTVPEPTVPEPTVPEPTVPGPSVPPPPEKACANRVVGDEKADVLAGTDGEDNITGRAGDDRLSGKGGDDCLHGNAGDDRVLGGPGQDRVGGGDGADMLDDEGGRDVFKSGAGPDLILAADGKRDEVRCGDGEGDRARVDPEDEVIRCERVTVVGD